MARNKKRSTRHRRSGRTKPAAPATAAASAQLVKAAKAAVAEPAPAAAAPVPEAAPPPPISPEPAPAQLESVTTAPAPAPTAVPAPVPVPAPAPVAASVATPTLTKETEVPASARAKAKAEAKANAKASAKAARLAHLRKVPRWNFWLGAWVAILVGLPLVSVAVYLLAGTGLGDVASPLPRVMRFALIFAGLPAFLSGGGVARLVAHRVAEAPARPRGLLHALVRPLLIAAFAMGAAGIGLTYLVVVPLGGMPERAQAWAPVAAAGFVAGALTGLAIGALVGLRQRRHATVVAAKEAAPA